MGAIGLSCWGCEPPEFDDPASTGGSAPANPAGSGGTSSEDDPPGGGGRGSPVVRWEATSELDELVGWASQPGPSGSTTLGGLGGTEMWPASPDELVELATRPEPLIIHVRGDLQLPQLEVGSNKTLLGGRGATLHGSLVIQGSEEQAVESVVIRNLRINGALAGGGVALDVRFAHNVWIDHCEIYDAEAGLLNVSRGSDFVTVSYNRFYYTPETADPLHRLPVTVGHADSAADTDEGHLRVTFHHNHWGAWIDQRSPRVRFGDVHAFNEFYDFVGNTYAVRAAYGSRVLVEASYFRGVHNSHEIIADDGDPAELSAVGNVYEDTSGKKDVAGSAFEPPYAYEPVAAEEVPALVTAGAGTH